MAGRNIENGAAGADLPELEELKRCFMAGRNIENEAGRTVAMSGMAGKTTEDGQDTGSRERKQLGRSDDRERQ